MKKNFPEEETKQNKGEELKRTRHMFDPSKHKRRCYNVVATLLTYKQRCINVKTTLYQRQNDVVCLLESPGTFAFQDSLPSLKKKNFKQEPETFICFILQFPNSLIIILLTFFHEIFEVVFMCHFLY